MMRADDEGNQWKWRRRACFQRCERCIHTLTMSIDISVKNRIVTRTMFLASIAPAKCSMLPKPAPFLMLFPKVIP